MNKNKIINSSEAYKLLKQNGAEFVYIPNPVYIHPQFEVAPLAPALKKLENGIKAVVMDMDGTITTTEQLCIHSLEFMVRRITGRLEKNIWSGLDPEMDYPNIIGNSTTKHVEYLIRTYKQNISEELLLKSFLHSALWTVESGKDKKRKDEVINNYRTLGLGELKLYRNKNIFEAADFLYKIHAPSFKTDYAGIVKMGIDIYYQRYHEILAALTGGKDIPQKNFLAPGSKNFIEPMPGAAFFLALIKGFLGTEAEKLSGYLIGEYEKKVPGIASKINEGKIKDTLRSLSGLFEVNPVKTSVVTSSIFYEADIVMKEVFKIFTEDVESWKISDKAKRIILKSFSSYNSYFDAFITASDSSEIRLKPYRDLYSIALYKLGLQPEDFNKVAGFEDSESGTIAIRCAGIGLCAAVPFNETSGHNLKAASVILKGGLPEAIIKHNLFLSA